MMVSRFVCLVGLLVLAGNPFIPVQARPSQPDEKGDPKRCEMLSDVDFSHIRDAPTQLNSSVLVSARGEIQTHCHVTGYIAPQVGFELRLPESWNSKFVQIGCGGTCGSATSPQMVAWCNDAVRRGYACIVTNQGHAGRGGLWALDNLQGEIDYGFRAAHVAAVAGKALSKYYYGSAPKLSYFMGCSGGGRQALVEAQRFPWDFDGIIAIDPSNLTCTGVTLLWNALAATGPDGKSVFDRPALERLHAAALEQCDGDDGLVDGIIGDPRTCKFDPGTLLCEDGKTAHCLSQRQVDAARKIYAGPTTSAGKRLFHGAMPGSELGGFFNQRVQYKLDYWRFQGFLPDPGPNWQAEDFDFDADFKRVGLMEAIYASDNPDLRKFRDRGGKLIIAQGWDDSGSPLPMNTLDYFETVERTMGGRAATRDFARLFMIPGKAHCVGGSGANAIDYLGYLEAWVEQGRAPDMIIGTHVESDDPAAYVRNPTSLSAGTFTRPHYAYPYQSRYKGRGDANDYRSFEAVLPAEAR